MQRFQRAGKRYLANKSDVRLFGFLVRDVSPHKDDVRVWVERLGQGCPDGTRIELLALYLPVGRLEVDRRGRRCGQVGRAVVSLSKKALDALRSHWAVSAIGEDDLARAETLVSERLAQRAVGTQIAFSFSWSEDSDTFLKRVGLAFEVAAVEGLEELSRPFGENMELRDQATAAIVPRVRHPPFAAGSG